MAGLSSMIGAIQALADDVTLLIRQEFRLAKAEIRENLAAIQSGVVALLVGAVAAFVAALLLIQAAVIGLAELMHPALAALVVALVILAIAAGCFLYGRSKLKTASLLPDRTIRSVKAQAEQFKETF
jgi:hypothetical protein